MTPTRPTGLALLTALVFALAGCGSVALVGDAGAAAPRDASVADVTPVDAPAPRCDLPLQRTLALPADAVTATLEGTSRNASTTCTTTTGTGGPEHYYRLHVAARTGVALAVEAAIDTALAIRTACDDPLSEVACSGSVPGGVRNPALRAVLDPGDYFVLVDQLGFGVGGAYTLRVTTFDAVDNTVCAAPRRLVPGTRLVGQDTSSAAAPSTPCAPSARGPVLYYVVTVPAANSLVVTASPVGAPWTRVVRLLAGCDAGSCLAVQSSGAPTIPSRATWLNRTGGPVDVVVAVGAQAAGVVGSFDLDTELVPPPANVSCAGATLVAAGTTLPSESTTFAHDVLTGCAPEALGRVLYYSAHVGVGETLQVVVQAVAGVVPVIRRLDGCDGGTCTATTGGTSAPNGAAMLWWTNTGDAARDVVFAVGGVSATSDLTYSLRVAVGGPQPAAVHCATAPTVTPSAPQMAQQLTGAVETVYACPLMASPGPPGRSLYYRATVPAGQTLSVLATPTVVTPVPTPGNLFVRLLPDCGATTCLGASETTYAPTASGAPAIASWSNGGTAAPNIVIAVGQDFDVGPPPPAFDLAVSLRAGP